MSTPFLGRTVAGPDGPDTLRVESLLGSGAFGAVYLARDVTTGARYAVKCPHTSDLGSAELQAFRNELQLAGKIDHPNVVRVVHAAPDTDPPYLVMEYQTGGTLEDAIAECVAAGGVPLELVCKWSLELVEGIAEINKSLLHRDLKPDNVLMDGDHPRITDFGLSKVVGAATRKETFKGFGALLYMAPEGWEYDTNEIQYDMYSIGIVLFQVATGEYPYDQPPNIQRGAKNMHLFQLPKVLSAVRPDLPAGFQQVVARLMEKRAADRYESWDAVKAALRASWQPPGEPAGTDAVLGSVTRTRDAAASRVLERDEAFRQRQDRARYHEFMRARLLAALRRVTQDVNERSSFGTITEATNARGEQVFSLPGGRELVLSFFTCTPARAAAGGTVEYAAGLVPAPYRTPAGSATFILVTTPTDAYGEWKAIRQDGLGAATSPDYLGEILGAWKGEVERLSAAFLAAMTRAVQG